MASSSRNSRIVRLLAALAPGLLGVAYGAQAPCADQEIRIEASQPMDVDYRNNNAVLRNVVITQCDMRIEAAEARVTGGLDFENSRWTVSGNVRIRAEGGNLQSDKAIVSFRDNLIARATITGTPAQFEQQRADGTMSRGRANTIDYETGSGTVSLQQNAWLSDGCNEITGQQLVYNIKAQRVQGRAGPATQDSKGRIVITIQPKNASGDPCAKPAPGPRP